MAVFLEEDGTGLTSATSYVSVTYSESYLGDAWATDNDAKESALMSASEYMDTRWGPRLKGAPLLPTQGLEMPRKALHNRYSQLIEGIPTNWKKAVCLYAKSYVAGTLYPTPAGTSSKDVKKKKTIVGPITTEVEYQGAATSASWLKSPLADSLIKDYLYSASGTIRN